MKAPAVPIHSRHRDLESANHSARRKNPSHRSPSMAVTSSQGCLLLQKQLKDLSKNPVDGFSAGLVDDSNVFEWQVTIIGPPDTLYLSCVPCELQAVTGNLIPEFVASRGWCAAEFASFVRCCCLVGVQFHQGEKSIGALRHVLQVWNSCSKDGSKAGCRGLVYDGFELFTTASCREMELDGGYFNAIMSFPQNYPNSPPSVRFTSEMWHPNVYPDGRVCISILHPPGEDPNGYELASERWTPVHTVESIVLSIISMLSSPNDESPANIEAAKEWREKREDFRKRVRRVVRKSQEMF